MSSTSDEYSSACWRIVYSPRWRSVSCTHSRFRSWVLFSRRMDPAKAKAVADWPTLDSRRGSSIFCGLHFYIRIHHSLYCLFFFLPMKPFQSLYFIYLPKWPLLYHSSIFRLRASGETPPPLRMSVISQSKGSRRFPRRLRPYRS